MSKCNQIDMARQACDIETIQHFMCEGKTKKQAAIDMGISRARLYRLLEKNKHVLPNLKAKKEQEDGII